MQRERSVEMPVASDGSASGSSRSTCITILEAYATFEVCRNRGPTSIDVSSQLAVSLFDCFHGAAQFNRINFSQRLFTRLELEELNRLPNPVGLGVQRGSRC